MFDTQCIETFKYVTSKAEISVIKYPLHPLSPHPKCTCRHMYARAYTHTEADTDSLGHSGKILTVKCAMS